MLFINKYTDIPYTVNVGLYLTELSEKKSKEKKKVLGTKLVWYA